MLNKLSGLFKKKLAYQRCFCDDMGNLTVHGQMVIKDLMKFCHAYTSTATMIEGRIDPIAMGIEEGRRTVLNRIQYYLRLSDDEFRRAKELSEE